MKYALILAPSAVEDLRQLAAKDRSAVVEAMEVHLRREPTKTSKSRIKRLRGLRKSQYRLRVNDVRVFYDVREMTEVLAIVSKDNANQWLADEGETDEGNSSLGSEG